MCFFHCKVIYVLEIVALNWYLFWVIIGIRKPLSIEFWMSQLTGNNPVVGDIYQLRYHGIQPCVPKVKNQQITYYRFVCYLLRIQQSPSKYYLQYSSSLHTRSTTLKTIVIWYKSKLLILTRSKIILTAKTNPLLEKSWAIWQNITRNLKLK